MMSSQRRERHRQETRAAILAAAREIAARDGWPAVTIRRVAEQIAYTPPILYQHFANKDDLLLELVREGFHQLRADLVAASARSPDPAAALVALALAYWDFAWQAPELYQVMYGLGGVPFGVAATWREGEEIGTIAARTVAAAAAGALTTDQIEERIMLLWSTLHGLVALTMVGRIAGGEVAARRLVEQAARDASLVWRAGEEAAAMCAAADGTELEKGHEHATRSTE